MDMPFATKCWLCSEPARPKAKWSSIMDGNVAKSVCSLIWRDTGPYIESFKSASYCCSCQQFVLEVDLLMRTMWKIRARILECRALMSNAVLKNLHLSFSVEDMNSDTEYDVDPIFEPQNSGSKLHPVPSSQGNTAEELEKHCASSIIPLSVSDPAEVGNSEDSSRQTMSPEAQIQLTTEDLSPVPERRQTRSHARGLKTPTISYREEHNSASESDASNDDPEFVVNMTDSDPSDDEPEIFHDKPEEPESCSTNNLNSAPTVALVGGVEAAGAEAQMSAAAEVAANALEMDCDSRNEKDKIADANSSNSTGLRISSMKRDDGKFHCPQPFCPQSYSHARSLSKHVKKFHPLLLQRDEPPAVFRCVKYSCSFVCHSGVEFQSHVKNMHLTPTTEVGKKLSVSKRSLKEDGKFHCFHDNCNKVYSDVSTLRRHITRSHIGWKKAVTNLKSGNRVHPKSTKNKSKQATKTPNAAATGSSKSGRSVDSRQRKARRLTSGQVKLTLEQRTPKEDGRFHCFHEPCTKSYVRERQLKFHIYMCHNKEGVTGWTGDRFRCQESECLFYSRFPATLNNHMKEVHPSVPLDPRPFKCLLCDKAYGENKELTNHINRKHKQIQKEFVCHLCGSQHFRKSELDTHMRIRHKREISLKCRTCHKPYFHKEDLDAHERKHVPGGPLTCLVRGCVQIFENEEELRKHTQSHYALKKLICEQCGGSFRTGTLLRKHQKIHTSIFEFPCTDCDKRFRSKQLQRSHFETVHAADKGQVYPCKLCDKTFHCKIYLYKHNSWHKHGKNANKPLKFQKKGEETTNQ